MEKITPQNLEAEQSVLGSVFVNQGVMKSVIDKLVADDFFHYRHKIIFNAMVDLYEENIGIDFTTLTNILETKGLLLEVGGIDYIVDLIDSVPSISNFENYLNIVLDKSITRRIMDACRAIIEDGFTVDDTAIFVDNSEKLIFDIAKERRTTDFVRIAEITEEVIAKSEQAKMNKGQLTGLDTGFSVLNDFTLGLQPSELIIVAARPSMGKSALALNIATNVARVESKPHVAFFSLEMGSDQLVGRILSSEASVDGKKIRTGNLSVLEWQQIQLAKEKMSKMNIVFDDSGTVKVTDLRQKCRKLKQEDRLDLIVIDYLQLLSGSVPNVNRVQEVSEISRTLKETARELKVPIIALSQLSRSVENRPDDKKIPVMADLRDSGSIEQDADIVLFLYRDDYYHPEDSDSPNQVKIIISKNRQGATLPEGFDLTFNKSFSQFKDIRSSSKYSDNYSGSSDIDDIDL
ncbi:replicative DNA helicase [Candidatus Izimaplasma bacterium ZiA1]|uniref:replicative DNA helicase n=1 Tax=Candidatus Izimoplasma sp. ZiA1 TaxID=2024899 RepID=UPI000BAA3DBD|nr:replicative DNA helicase [Candidatus Izimaplasma bacterium ZiA1]